MKLISIAAQWGAIRRVYPIYTAVAEEFTLSPGPYRSLDDTAESETTVIEKVQGWLAEMDELVQPHQFRYILDRTDILSSEDHLRALVRRYLDKDHRTDSDREKLHYLLNQYVFVCAPPSFRARDVTLEDVAQVLESVLGEVSGDFPEWLAPLAQLTAETANCGRLKDLQTSILTPGRKLKNGNGEEYFSATALVIFTHFNYCTRRTFTRLLTAELQAIDDGIRELDSNQVGAIDCSSAGFGEEETLNNIRQVLDELRASTSPAYSCDAVVHRILALRLAVESAVRRIATALTDSDELRIAAMEDQVQQLTRDLARANNELAELRIAFARLVARFQAAAAAPTVTHDAWAAPEAPELAPEPVPDCAPAPAVTGIVQECVVSSTMAVPSAPPTGAQDINTQVQQAIDEIRRSLTRRAKTPSGIVNLGSHTVLLSAGEIDAMNATQDVAIVAQQAIGLRSLLMKCLDNGQPSGDFWALGAYARTVLTDLQRTLGRNDTPMRDALAVSARQLRTVLQHAEQAARKARVSS
jgi:hypothetical protein